MKILMLSRDEKIFQEKSAVSARMIEYGALFEELHVVVLNRRFKIKDLRFKNEKIGKNVWVYSTNSLNLFFALFDAYKISTKILHHKPARPAGGSKILNPEWVVTSQDPFETGFVAAKIAKKMNAKLQIQIHTDFASPYFRKESIKNFIQYFIAKIVLPRADCTRIVSQRIKDSIIANCKLQIANYFVLSIFIDAEKIKAAKPAVLPQKSDFTILWVGRLEKEKNCFLAISAFAKFAQKNSNSGLVIIGDGKERENCKLQIANYKLQDKILLLGWQNDIAGYYKSADVLLVTSDYEGYGMQMVEARIAGIPVIAPDIGVAKEVDAYIADHTAGGMARMLSRLYNSSLPKPADYEYPYKDKQEYLRLYKTSFYLCDVGS